MLDDTGRAVASLVTERSGAHSISSSLLSSFSETDNSQSKAFYWSLASLFPDYSSLSKFSVTKHLRNCKSFWLLIRPYF